MARRIEAEIEALIAEREALSARERRPKNRKLHTLRNLLAWCKTRAGYEPPPADPGLL
jgi:hypothetical protein